MAMLVPQRVKWKKVNRDFYASRLSLWLTVRMTTIMDLLHLPSLAATLGEHWIHQPKAEWLSGREMKVDGKKDWVVSYLTYLWIYRIYRKNMKKRSVHLWSKKNKKQKDSSGIIHLLLRDFSIFQPIALPTKLLGGSFHGCALQP